MISATGMPNLGAWKSMTDDGNLETKADPGENEDGVSPRAHFGELVISWMADQTRVRKDFQAETQRFHGLFWPKPDSACFPPA